MFGVTGWDAAHRALAAMGHHSLSSAAPSRHARRPAESAPAKRECATAASHAATYAGAPAAKAGVPLRKCFPDLRAWCAARAARAFVIARRRCATAPRQPARARERRDAAKTAAVPVRKNSATLRLGRHEPRLRLPVNLFLPPRPLLRAPPWLARASLQPLREVARARARFPRR